MHIQPIDIPALLRAVIWPVMTLVALGVFRKPLTGLVAWLGQRVKKVAFAGFSVEMAQVQEMQPRAMDAEIRELEAGLVPQSGSTAISSLVNELQGGGPRDYVVIDLGSESSPRWLTSRLYLLSFLITLINRQVVMVFVETLGNVRKRFVGIASAEKVRWAHARKYGWLEIAGVNAVASQVGAPSLGYAPAASIFSPFDPSSNYLPTLIPNVIKQFLSYIRTSTPPPVPSPEQSEWVSLDKQQTYEHAKWLNTARIEELLGGDMSTARVTLLPNKTVNDLARPVLAQRRRFVAVIEPDRTLVCVVDRMEVLQTFAFQALQQGHINGGSDRDT
jgi:hypothetical protein